MRLRCEYPGDTLWIPAKYAARTLRHQRVPPDRLWLLFVYAAHTPKCPVYPLNTLRLPLKMLQGTPKLFLLTKIKNKTAKIHSIGQNGCPPDPLRTPSERKGRFGRKLMSVPKSRSQLSSFPFHREASRVFDTAQWTLTTYSPNYYYFNWKNAAVFLNVIVLSCGNYFKLLYNGLGKNNSAKICRLPKNNRIATTRWPQQDAQHLDLLEQKNATTENV